MNEWGRTTPRTLSVTRGGPPKGEGGRLANITKGDDQHD